MGGMECSNRYTDSYEVIFLLIFKYLWIVDDRGLIVRAYFHLLDPLVYYVPTHRNKLGKLEYSSISILTPLPSLFK